MLFDATEVVDTQCPLMAEYIKGHPFLYFIGFDGPKRGD